MMEGNRVVFPGEFLTTEEEFVSGENTFGDDEGNVFASSVGKPLFDSIKRVVSVKKAGNAPKPIESGAIVTAKVSLVKLNMLVVEMVGAEKNGVELAIGSSNATIMISRVSRDYVRDLNEAFCVGDYLKARVVEVTDYGIELTTSEPDLGVIKAFCSKCRQVVGMFSGKLKCGSCGSMEQRVTSSDYVLKHS